jgi:hypothetical protein
VRRMDTREAILLFQYAEKMKSGLIIGASLLNQAVSLRDDERAGGMKVRIMGSSIQRGVIPSWQGQGEPSFVSWAGASQSFEGGFSAS